MGMLPVQIDERYRVQVRDPASSPDGVHYWLALYDGDEYVCGTQCVLSWELLRIDDDEYNSEPLERAMAFGFAAAVLSGLKTQARTP